jgi:hypothetical protein
MKETTENIWGATKGMGRTSELMQGASEKMREATEWI